MKRIRITHTSHLILLALFAFITSLGLAQQNLTDPAYYSWKGKKTEPKPGFVILKSGSRMEGQLYLQGKDQRVEEIHLVRGEKDVELPPASVRSYGLMILDPTNDTDEDLYQWRGPVISGGMSSTNSTGMSTKQLSEQAIANGGKVTTKTKPMNGYVILRNGNTVKGELQLTDVNGNITEIQIKNDEGKFEYDAYEVKHYGLELTIAEITNNGKKQNKHEAMNFHPTTITMIDGTTYKGIAAFKKKRYIDNSKPAMGSKYSLILFAEKPDAIVQTIDETLVKELERKELSTTLTYVSYDDGYIVKGQFENMDFKDQRQEFNPGEITYESGETVETKLAQIKDNSAHFATGLRILSDNGEMTNVSTEGIARFKQTIAGQERSFVKEQGVFVEELYTGQQFVLMRNPFPESVSGWKTGLAKAVVSMGASAAANAMTEKGIERNTGIKADVNFRTLTDEELQALIDAGQNSDDPLKQSIANGASAELAGRELERSVSVKRVEWIIFNRVTNDRFIITKEEYKNQIQELLYSCEAYLMMDKSEKKQFDDFEDIEKTIQFVDNCYVQAQ